MANYASVTARGTNVMETGCSMGEIWTYNPADNWELPGCPTFQQTKYSTVRHFSLVEDGSGRNPIECNDAWHVILLMRRSFSLLQLRNSSTVFWDLKWKSISCGTSGTSLEMYYLRTIVHSLGSTVQYSSNSDKKDLRPISLGIKNRPDIQFAKIWTRGVSLLCCSTSIRTKCIIFGIFP